MKFYSEGQKLVKCIADPTEYVETLIIPEGYREIGDYVFCRPGLQCAKYVYVPDDVEVIGKHLQTAVP